MLDNSVRWDGIEKRKNRADGMTGNCTNKEEVAQYFH